MPWKLVQVDDQDPDALTNDELIAMQILVREHMGEPHDESNIHYAGWLKLQPACRVVWARMSE